MKKYQISLLFTLLLCGCTSVSLSSKQSNSSSDVLSTSQVTSISENQSSNSTSSVSNSSSEISSKSESSSQSASSSKSESSSVSSNSTTNTKLYDASIKNNTPNGYYESCRGKKGAALKQALHDIIKGHKSFGYSSTQNFYKTIDASPYDSSKMYFIYTGETSKSTSYNKEHVWAKSHGNFGTTQPMGSDLHNLHPCNSNLNSTRGNLDFDEGGELLSGYNGNNRRSSNSFEPSDFSKGDVARTIFYMAVRYEGDNGEKDLELSRPKSSNYNDFSSGASGVHGNFDALYKWATSGQDPVDDYEVSRNNIIYSDYQKNRNPFIDHPEFIQMIYDKNYQGPGALLDNNPFDESTQGEKTPQEEANVFIELVNAIETIDETSLEKINKAEEYYEKMSAEAKALVVDEYQLLQLYKEDYVKYCDEVLVNKAIQAIESIGEVTLDSKAAIENAEAIISKLNQDQLAKVTNYQTLLDARNKYDALYEEYLKEHGSSTFEGSFKDSKGASSSYGPATVSIGDRKFIFSHCYQSGSDFRLGHNSASEVSAPLKQAITNIGSHSSSMTCDFEISGLNTITLTYTSNYGTINNLYLLLSEDNGLTYKIVNQEKYDANKKEFTSSISGLKSGKYAIVIDGTKPRLVLDKIIIK